MGRRRRIDAERPLDQSTAGGSDRFEPGLAAAAKIGAGAMRIGFSSLAMAALGACLGTVFIHGPAAAGESPAGMAVNPALQAPAAGWTLKGAVLLSRHGIRGPTVAVDCGPDAGPKGCLDAVGTDPWPTLGVAAGHLVPEGYHRVRALGRFYRQRYAEAGLLPVQGCPAAGSVSFASDADERTIVTAGAVMDGMFAGCALDGLAVVPEIYRGPTCGYDKAAAAAASRQLVGGSWAKVAAGPLAGPLAAMDRIVGPLRPEICRAKGLAPPCSAAQIQATADDPGAIDFLSQPVEQLIMQYGSGTPASEVGWGRIEAATGKPIAAGIGYLNEIHALHDRAGGMPSYQAHKRGSPVLALVLRDLEEIAAGKDAAFRFRQPRHLHPQRRRHARPVVAARGLCPLPSPAGRSDRL
jgi:4-phytase/acid phosphatase